MKFRILLFLILLTISSYSGKMIAQSAVIETTGDVILIALPAATFASTFIMDDTQGSWQFAKSLLLNEAVTYGLKYTVNKSRPDGTNENSFPSGHTSTTFQSAAFIHRRYGFTNSIPAYALAGFTAFSRLDAQKHDGYDILFGAIIGISSSYIFTTEYQREHMELTFNSFKGNYMIGFQFKF